MTRHSIEVNGKPYAIEANGEMPLLWVLRDLIGLTGTKYGCGIGICGSCTILEGERAIRSCQTTLAGASGKSFTTIEGLSENGDHPIQRAWLDEDVSQCGYCQPGMIMELVAYLDRTDRPTESDLENILADHVCRCGSYPRIRKASLLGAKIGGDR